MNPLDVLQMYIELCNSPNLVLQDHLGQNSVVDWYGRTIRGKHKIQAFVKYDMCQQYQHKFNKATISGPIEVKPTHLATRQIYKEEDPTIFEGERQFQTPPHKSLTPVLPEITRGITFLPESDDDDLGLGVLQSDEQITPPQSVFKKIKTEPMEMAKKPIQEVKPPLQPPLTVDDTGSYSHLMYVESTGVLARVNQMKHRGVTAGNCNSESHSSPSSPLLEKETTLKIAYRIRLRDNQIYFSLIIYERISRNTNLRRNLCLDFNDIQEQEQRDAVIKARATEMTPKKRKTPLKRLFL